MAEENNIQKKYAQFEDYDEPISEKYRKPTVFGTIIRVIFYSLILIVNAAVIFRVCMAEDPGKISSLYITEDLKEAYANSEEFTVYTQTVYDMYTEDGVFYSTGMFFSPEAQQVQISVRYNLRTVAEALIREDLDIDKEKMITDEMRAQSKYGSLTGSDIKSGEYFVYRLADDNGNIYSPTTQEESSRFIYVYNTFTFNKVALEDTNLYIEIYSLHDGEADFDSEPVGRMKIYSKERSANEYELSSKEKTELSK